jgi:hypothetical protein
MGKLHAQGLSVARGVALLAALGGAGYHAQQGLSPADGLLAPGTPNWATQSLVEGLSTLLDEGQDRDRPAGSDACEVVRGGAEPPKVWSAATPDAASVFVWAQFANGSVSTGTGTIIAGSDAGQGNRLLTAAHLVDEEGFGTSSPSRVLAFGQDGVLLAALAVVVKGDHHPADRGQTIQEVRQDTAVLEPVVWLGGDKAAWNAMGAPLAQEVPIDGVLLGQSSGTALLEPGSSGGALFDDKGAVVGVLVQAMSMPKLAKEGGGTPFLDSLRAQPTGDASVDVYFDAVAADKLWAGVREQQGSTGIATPVVGPVRAALGAGAFVERGTAPFNGRLAVFPSGECRLGAVEAYPRFEADRLAAARAKEVPQPRPVSPERAWSMLQGLGWYPEGLDARVQWQALRLHVEDGHRLGPDHVGPLLALAKEQGGRVGWEAGRIAMGMEAYTGIQARAASKEVEVRLSSPGVQPPTKPAVDRTSELRSSIAGLD